MLEEYLLVLEELWSDDDIPSLSDVLSLGSQFWNDDTVVSWFAV